jgi:hypothetical protein
LLFSKREIRKGFNTENKEGTERNFRGTKIRQSEE